MIAPAHFRWMVMICTYSDIPPADVLKKSGHFFLSTWHIVSRHGGPDKVAHLMARATISTKIYQDAWQQFSKQPRRLCSLNKRGGNRAQ